MQILSPSTPPGAALTLRGSSAADGGRPSAPATCTWHGVRAAAAAHQRQKRRGGGTGGARSMPPPTACQRWPLAWSHAGRSTNAPWAPALPPSSLPPALFCRTGRRGSGEGRGGEGAAAGRRDRGEGEGQDSGQDCRRQSMTVRRGTATEMEMK